jgi:hypothetical protein
MIPQTVCLCRRAAPVQLSGRSAETTFSFCPDVEISDSSMPTMGKQLADPHYFSGGQSGRPDLGLGLETA